MRALKCHDLVACTPSQPREPATIADHLGTRCGEPTSKSQRPTTNGRRQRRPDVPTPRERRLVRRLLGSAPSKRTRSRRAGDVAHYRSRLGARRETAWTTASTCNSTPTTHRSAATPPSSSLPGPQRWSCAITGASRLRVGRSDGRVPGAAQGLCDSQRCLKSSSLEEPLLGNGCYAHVRATRRPARRRRGRGR